MDALIQTPLEYIQSITNSIRTQAAVRDEIPVLSQNEHLEQIITPTVFRKEDPSLYYAPLHKLETGGQAVAVRDDRFLRFEFRNLLQRFLLCVTWKSADSAYLDYNFVAQ